MKNKLVVGLLVLVLVLNKQVTFAKMVDYDNIVVIKILDDRDGYLYLEPSDNIYGLIKIQDDLSGDGMYVSPRESKEISESSAFNPSEIPCLYMSNLLKESEQIEYFLAIKDNILYNTKYDLQVCDIRKYKQLLDDFYKKNSIDKKENIVINAEVYTLPHGMELYSIHFRVTDISGPYNKYLYEYYLIRDGKQVRLDIDSGFVFGDKGIKVDDRGNLILEGSIGNKTSNDSKTLIQVSQNGEVKVLNNLFTAPVSKYDTSITAFRNLDLIGITDKGYLVLFSPDFYGRDNLHPVQVLPKLYTINYSMALTPRSEVFTKELYNSDAAMFYHIHLAKNGHIYTMDNSGKIYDLTTGKTKLLDKSKIGKQENAHWIGDVISTFNKTNRKINVTDIKSGSKQMLTIYRVDGKDYICVEDLSLCGYVLNWDASKRVSNMVYKGKSFGGQPKQTSTSGDVVFSDIQIQINGKKVDSHNIGGYSLILLSDAKSLISNASFSFKSSKQKELNPNIEVGKKVGNVLYTDIKTYFNGDLVQGLNVDNYTAIKVKAFQGRGFDVTFNDNTRRVDIISNPNAIAKTKDKPELKKLNVGDVIGNILTTDISVYIDGKEIKAYNCDGYMVLMVLDLDKFGFENQYNNTKRELKVGSPE